MELLDTLIKNGALGVLSAILLYLVLRLLKVVQESNESSLRHQIEDTSAKLRVAMAMEVLAKTVDVIGQKTQESTKSCSSVVFGTLNSMNEFLAEQRGRQQGRREASERFPIPPEFDDEK